MRSYDLIIGGTIVKSTPKVAIKSPYHGNAVGEVVFGKASDIEAATTSVSNSFRTISLMPAHERANLLRKISNILLSKRAELAEVIRDEAGKPIQLAQGEVDRAASTFAIAADAALQSEGSLIPFDSVPTGVGRIGLTKRFPLGPILAITPFNFPLNLVAHKVAPAIAAGNSILVKPSSLAPMSALILSEIAHDAGLPPGVLNVIPCKGKTAETMVTDHRFKMLSFTGSAAVGWHLKSISEKKKVTLELGGNAAAIVEPDADVMEAVRRLTVGAFTYAGQVCISVQRIFVHEAIASEFAEAFVECVSKNVKYGDPSDPEVMCGPMIDLANADRVDEWIEEACSHGARILYCGGERKKNLLPPTVLVNVDPSLRVASQEAFGPVVVIDSYESFEQALAKVNNSTYGLQAGVFTKDIGKLLMAFRELDVGGIIHNNAPTFRVDPMPYGGVKDSGLGREGLKYAIEEMTEPKLLVLSE